MVFHYQVRTSGASNTSLCKKNKVLSKLEKKKNKNKKQRKKKKLWNTTKIEFRGKFIVLNTYIKKKELR